ncbi:MAG: transposase [Deltaproteobacteria bacterium]|nr:transposase [Deltaproteobacteria bacterium]
MLAYSRPENKVSLGFVEGFNYKIRVIRRRAYGLRDENFLRSKILTCMLKEIRFFPLYSTKTHYLRLERNTRKVD